MVDVNKSQMRYEKEGSYVDKRYAQVFRDVYDNPDYMNLYHWGVFVATFAWEHHLKLVKFYCDNFITRFAGVELPATAVDLACGSGVWSMLFLHFLPGWNIDGVDISATSIDLASGMAESIGQSDKLRLFRADATSFCQPKSYQAGISCFVLEHLENPDALLINLARNLPTHSFAFVIGAISASEVDHVKEFHRESELILMAERCGFRVCASYCAAPESYPEEYRFLPRSMAMILQKRRGELW